jgi:plasmid maintenance system antidote protein VapI
LGNWGAGVGGFDRCGAARYFNTSPEFWLGLQSQYDLDVEEDELGERIAREVRV